MEFGVGNGLYAASRAGLGGNTERKNEGREAQTEQDFSHLGTKVLIFCLFSQSGSEFVFAPGHFEIFLRTDATFC